IIRKIASGGMGEVFLAVDPFCQRNLALKKIRSDKMHYPGLRERFLKEVKIAAQLSHPGIIPIYQIHQTENEIYYTMPLVEGETLKEIIQTTLKEEKAGLPQHPIGSSIPALMRIFLNICQAIAYSHAKNILHRDLKPENIIIGPYGEVLILDWGLADFVFSTEEDLPIEEEPEDSRHSGLTRPGKIAGTLAYLAPERIFGKKASYASDIYALGIILYQLLTLRFPFRRKSIKQYKKEISHESIMKPEERAPYRDIPSQLSLIAKKCLAKRPEKRYSRVEEILVDLNNYIEGHAEWIPYSSIQVECKSDWKFQENILLAKHIALTQKSDIMEWVNLMIAKESFPGKIKLETHVRIKEEGRGLGFLLNLKPLEEGKDFFQESFFIWIGSEKNPGCHLFRSNVELMSNPDLCLKNQLSHFIRIEKTDYHIKLYIDQLLAFDYLSHTPFNGPHFGVVLKDADLEMGAILLSKSSPNILVNCLAVPDMLLTLHHFKEALSAYRQIASSFTGRLEGKEAIFRAGIVLLEEGKRKKGKKEKEALFEQALEEFNQLKESGGSPLEYLGKSLVYKATSELQEEVKCLELAMRRFAKHPLVHLVKDQTLFRLHEASYKDKVAAYEFALLTLRHIKEAFTKQDNQKLLQHLQKNCKNPNFLPHEDTHFHLTLQLAFWLCKPKVLIDVFHNASTTSQKTNTLYCLLYLGCHKLLPELLTSSKDVELAPLFTPILDYYDKGFKKTCLAHSFTYKDLLGLSKKRSFLFLLDQFYLSKKSDQIAMLECLEALCKEDLIPEDFFLFQRKRISFLFYLKKSKEALLQLDQIPSYLKEEESSPFYFLQGCALANLKGISVAKEHFFKRSENTPSSTTYLIDHFLSQKPDRQQKWIKKNFFWEKIQLLEQLSLLYQSADLQEKQKTMQKLLEKEWQITVDDD
ncbi:MAG: protein kinase, partial [Chlamydiota bacterium]